MIYIYYIIFYFILCYIILYYIMLYIYYIYYIICTYIYNMHIMYVHDYIIHQEEKWRMFWTMGNPWKSVARTAGSIEAALVFIHSVILVTHDMGNPAFPWEDILCTVFFFGVLWDLWNHELSIIYICVCVISKELEYFLASQVRVRMNHLPGCDGHRQRRTLVFQLRVRGLIEFRPTTAEQLFLR